MASLFRPHIALLARLKRIFRIALATDPDDTLTHPRLTSVVDPNCPVQTDNSHCACLAADALECLMTLSTTHDTSGGATQHTPLTTAHTRPRTVGGYMRATAYPW